MQELDKNTVRTTLYLPEEISNILKKICTASGLTLNGLIKSVVFNYLTDNNYIEGLEIKQAL